MIANAPTMPAVAEAKWLNPFSDLPTAPFVHWASPSQIQPMDLVSLPPGHVVVLPDVTRATLGEVLQLLCRTEQLVVEAYNNPATWPGDPTARVIFPIVYVIGSIDEFGPPGLAKLSAHGGVFLTRQEWPGELKDLLAVKEAARPDPR